MPSWAEFAAAEPELAAKVSGIAHEVAEPPSPVPGAARMRIEIREVAFTHLNAAGDRLVVDWWRAGGNRQRTERT